MELANCRIFGKDESLDTIGIRSGRIASIGRGESAQSRRIIDLEGRTVVPGYIDSHTHLMNLGLSLTRLDLSDSRSREEALEKAKVHAGRFQGKVIVGYGWDETLWGEKDYISRDELDFSEKPVILYRKDMHMAVLNSKALSLIGLSSRDGAVKEESLRLLDGLAEPGDEEVDSALVAASDRALSEGITTVRDIMDFRTRAAIEKLPIPIRVFQIIYDRVYSGQHLNGPSSWGIKIFLDGSVGSETAAHDGWNESNLKFSQDKLHSHLSSFWHSGIPVAMHAIGEIAVKQAINSLSSQKGSLRNSIEHFELVRKEDLEQINQSTVLSSQPNFLQWSMEAGLYQSKLGPAWFGKDNPFRTILDSGLHLAFGSDCMPMGPGFGIGLAVNSPHREQRITIDEAIRAYTEGGAYLLHEEHVSGKLEVGYRADLAVFDESYLSDLPSIGSKKAIMTVVGGDIRRDTIMTGT